MLVKVFLLMGCLSTHRTILGLLRSHHSTVSVITERFAVRPVKSLVPVKMATTDESATKTNQKDSPTPWFASGLAFSCSMCGNCCSGSSGSVRFTDVEAVEMAAQVKISPDEFYTKYTRRRGRGSKSYFELKEVRRDNGDMDCIFLDRVKVPGKAICSLYGARPGQCRTWPFWPELLENEKAWKNAKLGPEGCPGIGKGTIVPYEEIIRQRDLPTG